MMMVMMMMMIVMMIVTVRGHEYYPGPCPALPPLPAWDWARFSGSWRAALKMNTRSSCVRYEYGETGGQRSVVIFLVVLKNKHNTFLLTTPER